MTSKYRLFGTVAAVILAGLAKPVAAQDKPEDGGEICVSVAHIWTGSSADVARIAMQPVPDSFRRNFFGDPCTRFSLVVGSLLDWHLAFGDERSSTAALDFLATNMMPDRDFIENLDKAVMASQAAAAAEKTKGMPGKATARLSALAGQARTDTELAALYLRAAEFYGSSALLAKAERYALPVIAVNRLRRRELGEKRTASDDLLDWIEVYQGQADTLEMYLAVLKAVIARNPAQFAAADAVLKSKENPFYRTAADEAYTHGDGFCEIGDREDLANYAKACGAGNFESQAKDWLGMRARLDILKLSLSDDAKDARNLDWMDVASAVLRVIAIERAQRGDDQRSLGRYPEAETEITLRLARADAIMRLAEKAPRKVMTDGRGLICIAWPWSN